MQNQQVPEQTKPTGSGRFDYVKYDEESVHYQEMFKTACKNLEALINNHIKSPRPKATALTKLEECYAWVGKGVRDDQVLRNNGADLQETRGEVTHASDHSKEVLGDN